MSTSSWYRRSLWNYKGNKEYTRSGYEAAATRFDEKDLDVDCTDRHYLITGSNSGIGLQIAMEVAKRGGIIHMVCRNQEAATRARSEIITTTGNDKIHLHIVDLAKPCEVVSWAQRFAAQHERLHVLVHNAGCMVHERRLDEDGVEANFAVNTLAVHVITLTLMPLLERSDDSRVILVSSAGMLCVRLEPHDLMHANMEPFDGRLVYSQNKRQQVVMALWYAQRYNKVHFASMHPGWADTPAVRTSLPQFYEMMKDNLRTPEQGADTAVWLAISKAALKHPSGLFFQDREPVSTHLPLAWTKSSIEEEDFLMTNIQDVYTKVHTRMFPQTADAHGTTESSPSTSQSPAPTPQPEAAAAVAQRSTGEGASSKAKEEQTGVEETSLTEDPLETEPKTPEIPVLPPPPAPASKVTSSKSEVQEVAEIHAPPASSRKNEAAEMKEEAKEIQPQEEKKTDAVEEKRTEKPEEKTEKPEEAKTDKPEDKKTNTSEEQKTDKPEEPKSEKVEEPKSEKVEEPKSEKVEEPKSEKVEEPKSEKVEEPKSEKVEEPKSEKVEEPKTEKVEEPKTEKVEETKTEKVEETKTEKPEETKTEKPEEMKTDKPEEKTDTSEAKGEEPSPSSPENAEKRTEAPQDNEGKGDATPPPPPTSLPEP